MEFVINITLLVMMIVFMVSTAVTIVIDVDRNWDSPYPVLNGLSFRRISNVSMIALAPLVMAAVIAANV